MSGRWSFSLQHSRRIRQRRTSGRPVTTEPLVIINGNQFGRKGFKRKRNEMKMCRFVHFSTFVHFFKLLFDLKPFRPN